MNGVKNDYGIINARHCRVEGYDEVFTATHRNPQTGEIWVDNFSVGKHHCGWWILSDRITFI